MKQEELKHILYDHRQWLYTLRKEGKQAILKDVDLQGFDFRGANLQSVNLVGANLTGCKLILSNLKGAWFNNANLASCDLTGADLTGADLRGAKFTVEMRNVFSLNYCQVTKDQLPWLALHPEFSRFYPSFYLY